MQKRQRGGSVKILVALSALAAIGIILGKFLAFNVTDFMRFSLENISILFAGIVFGPAYGAALGAVQDLVGCLAVGYTVNPFITVGCALTGLVCGIVYRLTARFGRAIGIALSCGSAHLIGSVITKTIGLSIYYSMPFGITLCWRILNYVIVGTVETFLLFILLNSKQLLTQINKITPFSTRNFASTSDAKNYAMTVSGVFSKPGLERVDYLLKMIGNPEKDVKVVHVSGTNGKGSFCAMLSSVLRASGLKIGSFNSPYLIEMREAIRIDGVPIYDTELTSLLDALKPYADSMADKPTEFELLTAAAYLAFKNRRVDVAIVECGMGGRRDATNVISSPLLSVITSVSVDHTSFLGNTVTEIASEKAGIIKRGCPVLTGADDPEAITVIKARAAELDSPLAISDEKVTVNEMTLGGTVFDHPLIKNVKIELLGAHQPKNASLVIKAAYLLKEAFADINDDTIRKGLALAEWQGRFEVLCESPILIFDGAHNTEGIRSAKESAKIYFSEKVVCLTGVLNDKDYLKMADEIAEIASHAITVTPDSPRALPAEEYASVLASRGINSLPAGSIAQGVKLAMEIAKRESLPVLCLGSLYLYRNVAQAVKNTII